MAGKVSVLGRETWILLLTALVLAAWSAPAHAAAGRPARPDAPGIVHAVLSSRHFRPPPRSARHRSPHHRPRRHPHCPHWLQDGCSCAGPTALPFPGGLGQGACPSPSPGPSPRPAVTGPSPGPTVTGPSPRRTVTSPSPSRTTSAPAPASPATPPAVHPPPLNRLRRHRPGRALHGASAAFSHVYSNLLRPATWTQAGPIILFLMIVVLIPCAAAAVLRYVRKR